MSDAEDPAQKKDKTNTDAEEAAVASQRARRTKELELRKEARRREAFKVTEKALRELRDEGLNPFAGLGKLYREQAASKLSPEKAAAKEARRKEALKVTLAGLKLVEEEMAAKRKLSAPPDRSQSKPSKKSYQKNKKSGPQPQDETRSSRSKKPKTLFIYEDDAPEEYFGTAKSRRRRRPRTR